jgi:5-formyltetrahydrofolate cyclo-ligase
LKNKPSIRTYLLKQRQQLSDDQISVLSAQIINNITSSPYFQQSQTIAIYYPVNNEVNLLGLINQHPDKIFLLPVVNDNQSMFFKTYHQHSQLIKNKYGIAEPQAGEMVKLKDIDLCLMPLLGFSRCGNRLGMGGGYYDRYFALNQFQQKATILAGIAYDFQEDDTIHKDPWDIHLTLIYTNKEVIKP